MSKAKIEATLQLYFDGSYELDKQKARDSFHPDAHIYGVDGNGGLDDLTVDSFLALFDNLDSPESVHQEREDEIISIDLIGEHAAVARVRLRVGQLRFIDALSFVRVDGRWLIITKISSGVKIQ